MYLVILKDTNPSSHRFGILISSHIYKAKALKKVESNTSYVLGWSNKKLEKNSVIPAVLTTENGKVVKVDRPSTIALVS